MFIVELISKIVVGIVALEHLGILYFEMFMWTTPRSLKSFKMTMEEAKTSQALAGNQGLYNGFLAAGLLWGLLHPSSSFGWQIQLFFILCVVVAAIYGGLTVKRSIWVVQGGPAVLALVFLLVSWQVS